MSELVWLDGAVRPRADTRIDPFDHGLTLGDGFFETIAAVDRRPVFWQRHLRRLRGTAARIGVDVPFDDVTLARGAAEMLDAHGTGRARLRITVTSGPGPLGPPRPIGPATVMIATAEHAAPPEAVAVITVPWVRNERSPLAGVKSTSYGEAVMILRDVRRAGADEAILGDSTGRVSEGATSNVFASAEGRLLTPALTSGCLPGIVRQVLLDAGIGAEADLPLGTLDTAEEMFLTSSLGGVVPISSVDGRQLTLVGGPRTTAAAEALEVATRADRAIPWP